MVLQRSKCGCFVLINKWHSWGQSAFCAIWMLALSVQYDCIKFGGYFLHTIHVRRKLVFSGKTDRRKVHWKTVWPVKNRQISIKVAPKCFHWSHYWKAKNAGRRLLIRIESQSTRRTKCRRQCDQLWPFLPLWQHFKVFGFCLRIYLALHKFFYVLWQILYAIGEIFIDVNGKISKNKLAIWSHWSTHIGKCDARISKTSKKW